MHTTMADHESRTATQGDRTAEPLLHGVPRQSLGTTSRATGKVLVLGEGMTHFLTVIRSLGRRGLEVHVGWCSPDCPALRSRYIARRHFIPSYAADGVWKRRLLALLEHEQFDLVIPTNDQCVRPLQQHREELSAVARVYVLNERAFEVVFDKAKSVEVARSAGLSVPRSRIVTTLDECRQLTGEFGWPLVLKPLTSFSPDDLEHRQGVVKAYNDHELQAAGGRLLKRGPALAQECFVGKGVGVELLVKDGEVLAAFQHERLHLPPRGGASTYRRSVPLSPELLNASRRFVAALSYTGVIMVEFLTQAATGQWRFVEANGRFWGSLPLAVAAGADFPYYLYQMLVRDVTNFPHKYRLGLYCRNLTSDLLWAHENFRADHSDHTLSTVPAGRVLRELANPLLLREASDTFVVDDPVPGFVELAQFTRRYAAKFAAKANRRIRASVLRQPLVRRRQVARTKAALREARSVLFVCLGNVCRSPFAEHYARRILPAAISVKSSGLYPIFNRSSPESAVAAAKEWGVDLADHRSDVLNDAAVAAADVIFDFDESLHEELGRRFPQAAGKIHRFALLDDRGPLEVADPFGGSLDDFRATYRQIAGTLDQFQSPATGPAK